MSKGATLTAIILTKNEEKHIARAIESLADLATSVLVVDSGSTDNTVAIARSLGAIVLTHRFVNYSKQFQWAIENDESASEWIMRLDADERLGPDLIETLRERLSRLPDDVVGINLLRRHIWMNRWIKHGGRFPLVLLRIWRRGRGRIEDRWMDEHIVLDGGLIITIPGEFYDHNLNGLSFFIDKHNKYATREALDVLIRKHNLLEMDESVSVKSTGRQAALKRFVKENYYNNVPFYISTVMYFLWRYIFQLGFLDGSSGTIYHVLQGFWYRFLVGAKVKELELAVTHLKTRDAVINELSRLTDLEIRQR